MAILEYSIGWLDFWLGGSHHLFAHKTIHLLEVDIPSLFLSSVEIFRRLVAEHEIIYTLRNHFVVI